MKLIKISDSITAIFKDGTILSLENCNKDTFEDICNHQDDEEYIRSILSPKYAKVKESIKEVTDKIASYQNSQYLNIEGNIIYIPTISKLSVPTELADAIIKAELEKNEELINSYLRFWTLVSLNPDSSVRKDLFWFLFKYGMTITKSGLFVAYRNVEIKSVGTKIDTTLTNFISLYYLKVKKQKKSPKNYIVLQKDNDYTLVENTSSNKSNIGYKGVLSDLYMSLSTMEDSTTYTDSYTNTFTIKLGKIVTIPRTVCDSNSSVTCSSGLHVAGKKWLEAQGDYMGKVGLVVLVNPADVVAVPHQDSYGKMRVCSYYPISVVEKDGNTIKQILTDGYEDDFIDIICYSGEKNEEDLHKYKLEIPNIPELNTDIVKNNLLTLAKSIKKTVD